MRIALEVAWTLLREALRALAFPLHAALYLPRSGAWKRRARAALAARPAASTPPAHHPLGPGGRTPHVLISAGEVSGEIHAARLMEATSRSGPVRWSCFGGARQRSQGGTLLFPLSEHAIMGVSGVLRSLPFLLRACACYLRVLRHDRPDLVVLVDYPGLHLVLGRLARKRGIPVLHYIAPQHWAWAPWRLARYRGCVDVALTILPFEPAFWETVGLRSAYVGHPLLDHLAAHPPERPAVAAVRARPTLCLLPGSRRGELCTNVPAFVALARALRGDFPDLRFVVPHVDPRRVELIQSLLAGDGKDLLEVHLGPLAPWLAGARAVLAKSGTGSLEACLYGTPTVVVYKMKGWLADWARRRYLTVPWIALANLIAGRAVIPEVLFADAAGWTRAAQALRTLLADGPERARCLQDLEEVRRRLGPPGASGRAAAWVRAMLADRRG